MLSIFGCVDSASEGTGGDSSSSGAASGGGADDGSETFEAGRESGYVSAGNLAFTDVECLTTRNDALNTSTLTCNITVDSSVSLSLAQVTATGKAEGVEIAWGQPRRRYGNFTFPSGVNCSLSNSDLTQTCSFTETNIAADVVVDATVSLPSQSLSNSISSEVDFQNECLGLAATTDWAAFGEGTSADPYLLCFSGQWQAYTSATRTDPSASVRAALLASHFRVGKNLEQIGTAHTIGTFTEPFTGVFQGNGFTLEGILIGNSGPIYSTMFAYLSGATIDYFTVENISIGDVTDFSSALVGRADNSTISRVLVKDGVMGGRAMGGIATELLNNSVLKDSGSENLSMDPYDAAGGLVWSVDGTSKIERSYSTVTISSTNASTGGGVAAFNAGTIEDCYAQGNITTTGESGGLIGVNQATATVRRSYSTGTPVGAGSTTGGLFGTNDNSATLADNFWDETSSGRTNARGGAAGDITGATGKTTAEMKQQATYTNWDFVNIWSIIENIEYPYFENVDFNE